MDLAVQIAIVVFGIVLTALFTLIVAMLKDLKKSISSLWEKFDEFPHQYVTQRTCDIRHGKTIGVQGG